MTREQVILSAYWWEKLLPLRRKFVRETELSDYEKEDLEQECFLQLQKALEQYDPHLGVPFQSYYKLVLRGWRANQNKKKHAFIIEEEQFLYIKDERVDIEKEVEMKMLIEEVMRKIENLEEDAQKIMIAYYLENKKIDEIAGELNLKYKTVEAKKKRALNRLKVVFD